MLTRLIPFPIVFLCALPGCQGTMTSSLAGDGDPVQLTAEAPPWAEPGSCWGKNATPAVVETVTEQVVVQPAEINSDGTVIHPAIYRTETRQAIIRERQESWVETPCPDVVTPEFIASLQRALQARGLYRGTITGQMDGRTRTAVRRFQKPEGLDSSILSLASARKLGLVALERDEVAN